VLAAVIYFALRTFALPTTARISATLILIWLYILIAGAPPSAIRAGVVATFVLAARLFGRQVSPLHCTTDSTIKVRFSATVGEEPEIEVALV
jgi:competence protein ComEC